MSLISILPSLYILLLISGLASCLRIPINDYTIIVIIISMGLTIDYSIHILNAIRKEPSSSGFHRSIVLSAGVPVFLSFLTSLFALSTLFLSSFTGAVQMALLLVMAVTGAFLISVFVLPLFFIPKR